MSDITDVIEPKIAKKPKWIRVKLPTGKKYTELRSLVDGEDCFVVRFPVYVH